MGGLTFFWTHCSLKVRCQRSHFPLTVYLLSCMIRLQYNYDMTTIRGGYKFHYKFAISIAQVLCDTRAINGLILSS